jgi:hypothetical protein
VEEIHKKKHFPIQLFAFALHGCLCESTIGRKSSSEAKQRKLRRLKHVGVVLSVLFMRSFTVQIFGHIDRHNNG